MYRLGQPIQVCAKLLGGRFTDRISSFKENGNWENDRFIAGKPILLLFSSHRPDHNTIEITGSFSEVGKDVCQSCGMKMQHEDYGKNADGSTNTEYCKYCYPDGKFNKEETMEEMIKGNLQFLDEKTREALTEEEAIEEMRAYFPLLKRWKQ